MKFIILLFALLLWGYTEAQSNCLSDTTIISCRVGTNQESFAFNISFVFTKDSVIMKTKGSEFSKLTFIILKSDCTWNEKFTEGKSIYEVMLRENERKATLVVTISTVKQSIEILYESSKEPRVFTVCR